MINEPIKIVDLASLEREKQRLKMLSSYQEQLLQDKIANIKNHYSEIIGEEFLPYSNQVNKKISNVLDIVNEFILGKFLGKSIGGKNKTLSIILKVTQVTIIRFLNGMIKKK